MRRSFTYAMLLVIPSAYAQTPNNEWYAKRFGINLSVPLGSYYQPWNGHKNFNYNEGDRNARYNNSKGLMTANGIKPATVARKHDDPDCHPWQDLFEISDLMPAQTWVRTSALAGEHYPYPDSAVKPVEMERVTKGVVNRLMFRGNNLNNSLNVLWNVIPVVWPHNNSADAWTNIKTDQYGNKIPTALSGLAPSLRDWYRPAKDYWPYLKSQFQEFVYWTNNAVALKVRELTPSGDPITVDFNQKTGFQLGNEPAGGRPGGSSFAQVGSWKGLGDVMNGVTAGIDYKATKPMYPLVNAPETFGTNPLNLPAFSYLTEGMTLRTSQMQGLTRAFQESGALTPGLNEIATYKQEMEVGTWASQCGRRSVHYRSPQLRWKFNNNDFGSIGQINADMLFYGPGDPQWGRWETKEEYAKRWVEEMEKTVDMISNLAMPTASKIVDITECYVTNGEVGISYVDSTTTYQGGGTAKLTDMTLDQIRDHARRYTKAGNNYVLRTEAQIPPTRAEILVAIRNELYKRDVIENNLTKNLGRIYWWGAYNTDPRYETGIVGDATGNASYYHPFMDFRFNVSEIKALWGIN